MNLINYLIIAFLFLSSATFAQKKSIVVKNSDELADAIQNVEKGTSILLADGIWKDIEITLEGHGTKQEPITLAAQHLGKVRFDHNYLT